MLHGARRCGLVDESVDLLAFLEARDPHRREQVLELHVGVADVRGAVGDDDGDTRPDIVVTSTDAVTLDLQAE